MAAIVSIANGQPIGRVGWIVAVYVIIRILDDLVVAAVTIGGSVHMHPMLVMVSILVGEQTLGPSRHGGRRAAGDRGQGDARGCSSSTAGTSRGLTCPPADGPGAFPSMSADLALPARLLMGSGPTNPDPRVLRAMATGLVGQFDPTFTALMAETQDLLRQVFRTRNRATFPVPGTSRAGMEAAVVSVDRARRAGRRRREWPLRPPLRGDRPARGRRRRGGAGALGRAGGSRRRRRGVSMPRPRRPSSIVHAETSTGVMNPVRDIAAVAHRRGALVIVDAVCSFAGAPLETDAWGLDVVDGRNPEVPRLPLRARARHLLGRGRPSGWPGAASPIRSNYLDLTQLDRYWSPERLNHHTAPTTMVYGLREALRIVLEEGLDAADRAASRRGRGDGRRAPRAGSRALRPAAGARPRCRCWPPCASPTGSTTRRSARGSSRRTGSRSWGRSAPSPAASGGSARWRETRGPRAVARTLGALADVLGIARPRTAPGRARAASQHFDAPARAAARA